MKDETRLSNRNAMIQELLQDGEKLKNFYRFVAQNPEMDLHTSCQIILQRSNASICYSLQEWNAMERRVRKGHKAISYYDRDGQKQFLFDATDTYGNERFLRMIYPMRRLLIGLDELNETQWIDVRRHDYLKILSGVASYLKNKEDFDDNETRHTLLVEGIAYSLYCKTGFPKGSGIRLQGYPYSLQENAELFTEIKEYSDRLQEEVEDAFIRRATAVPVIDDIEEDVVTDEPILPAKEWMTVEFGSAIKSNYKGYDVFTNKIDGEREDVWLGKAENYDNQGYYDNSDHSLIFVSKNYKMWGLLSTEGYTLTQKEFVENELFQDEDYEEFSILKNGLLKQFECERELKFGVEIENPNSGLPFVYPNYRANPLYLNYMLTQEKYPKSVVLMRVGDFYEVMGEKAKEASQALDIVLTGRDVGLNERVPMCGFPYHATELYVNKLLKEYSVVVLEEGKEPFSLMSEQEAERRTEPQPSKEETKGDDDEWTDEEIAEALAEDAEETKKNSMEDKPKGKSIRERKRKDPPQKSLFDILDGKANEEQSPLEKLKEWGLKRGSLVSGGKIRIYDEYLSDPTTQEFANFLKEEYGWGGSYAGTEEIASDGKGLAMAFHDKENPENNVALKLNWTEVALGIADLIDENKYFTEREQETYDTICKARRERIDAKTNEEKIRVIVRQMVKIGTENTYNGEYEIQFYRYDESANFIREHRSEIEEQLLLQAEVEAILPVEFPYTDSIRVDFNPWYCTNLMEEAIAEKNKIAPLPESDGITESFDDEVEAGNTNLTEVGFEQSELGGAKQRYKNNVEAIRLVKRLYTTSANPSIEEKKILAMYVGWGGLSDVFDETKEKWQSEYKELKDLLTDEEYATAKGSVLNAHFTSKEVIEGIYQALEKFGVRGNNKILEPALGTGNFFGFMPQNIAEGARLYGVELDGITGKIASKLYPNATIQIKGFEQTSFADNTFDLFVSNVPFGNYTVYDSNYARQNFHIHDYFIAKGIDKLKSKGLMAVITSKGTMDKVTPTMRKYIADRAELISAIRLPNTAFKQTANTQVTSDILFFRKREERIDATTENTEWLSIGKTEEGYEINRYFVSHPEMMLGTLSEERGLYGFVDITLNPDGRELTTALSEAISRLPQDIYENPERKEEGREETIEADYNIRPLCYKAENGKLYMRLGDEMVEQAIPSMPKDAYNRISAMIKMRDSIRHILDMQLEGCDDETLQSEQRALNAKYDSFIRQYGFLNSQTNHKLFRDDGDSALLFAAEELSEDKKSAKKADVFTKRTIRPYTQVTSTDDCFEALQMSKNERGLVDIAFIEELTKKDYGSVLSELGEAVYRNPIRVNEEDKYTGFETAEEYLSGRVVEKLRTAIRYVEQGKVEYERNVKALEGIQPTPLTANDITARIGSSWVEKEYYKQFLCETLRIPYYMRDGIELYHNPHDGSWRVDRATYARGYRSLEITQIFGTNRANAFRLFEDCLNQKSTQIYDTIEEDGKEKRVLNQAETIAAREKQNKLKETFKSWIFTDPERRYSLEQTYNDIFNQVRLPVYDGSYLKFPEMNPAIELRPHQKNAVHRIVSTGDNTLLHHVVGSGKTITMIASGVKLKQYGLAKKVMYVVPNHLVQQWGTEFRRLYPKANILITQKDDLEKEKRKQFVSKVAMGDWDGIIIAQSSFAKIGISPERQIAKIRQEISGIEESITSQQSERGTTRASIKNLERMKKSREAQLKKLLDDAKKDNVLIFEKLGVDFLFVDEADAYKNLFLFTKMNNVAGISNAASQRASDLQLKIEYINELHGGDKGVVFATGTPISNSMTEMYTMQTYLQKSILQKQGIHYFDAWAADFGEAVTSLELAPSGQGYRAKTRFSKFTNLPELLTMYRSFADVQTSDMVKLDVPEAERKVVTVKPSDTVIRLTEEIAERAERIYGGGTDPHVDNMLKVTSDGKKLALDARCFDPYAEDSAYSKLNECANNVYEIYKQFNESRGTQLVFCDLSTPKKAFDDYEYGKDFDAYNDLKYKLVEKGIPKEEIAFIHDANSDLQKQALFQNVNTGKVRVLIGSTEKCGAGTNVQQRLVALHHLDAPYRPRDLIQRNGRGIRQGNRNKKIQIFTYVTERTFDSYSYQILENKQRFIAQIDRGDLTIREAEDIDEATLSYAEIKAITSANPKIKRKMELDNELQQLRILESQYKKNLYDLQDKIHKTFPEQIQRQTLYLERLRRDIETAKENIKPNEFSINVLGKVYTDRKEGGIALLDALHQNKSDTVVAEYCGFKISLDPLILLTSERTATVAGEGRYQVYISQSAYGTLTRFDHFFQEMPEKEGYAQTKLEGLQRDLKRAEEELTVPFEHTERIQSLHKELTEINAELDLNRREEIIVDDDEASETENYAAVPEERIRGREKTVIDENDKIEAMDVALMPDYTINQNDMNTYGYAWNGMLPLRRTAAERIFQLGLDVYRLYEEDTEGAIENESEFDEHDGLFGIEKPDWNSYLQTQEAKEYFATRGMVAKSAEQVLRTELDYVQSIDIDPVIDDVATERIAIESYLKNTSTGNETAMREYFPQLIDEFTDKFENLVYEQYGWTEYDVRKALAEHLENENFRAYGNELAESKQFTKYMTAGLQKIKWLGGRIDEFEKDEISDIVSDLKEHFVESKWDRSGYEYDSYDDWYDDFSEEKIKPYLSGRTKDVSEKETKGSLDTLSGTEKSLDARSIDYKKEVTESVEKEFEKFKSTILQKSVEEIFLSNYEIHVRTELLDVIEEDGYLEDKYYRALYVDKGNILKLLYDDVISSEYASIENGEATARSIKDYCDYYHVDIMEDEMNGEKETERREERIPIYYESAEYARSVGEIETYRESNRVSMACIEEIGNEIGNHYKDNTLGKGFEEPLIEKYGKERIDYVLATVIRNADWDRRYSNKNREWAESIPISVDENVRRNLHTVTHPGLVDLFANRMRKDNEKKEENEKNMPEQEKVVKKEWLHVTVPPEAVIKTYDKHSYLRMPLSGVYAGYAYNIFNSRMRQTIRVTNSHGDTSELCLRLTVEKDQEIVLKKDKEELVLTGEQFVEAVDNTNVEDYEASRDEQEWVSLHVPQEAMRGMYEKASLFSMPKGEYSGYFYYIPNSMVTEDKKTEDGSVQISLPDDFKVVVKNKSTGDEKELKAEDLFLICKDKKSEDYIYERHRREQSEAIADRGWKDVVIGTEAKIAEYEKASLFRMPNGKYEDYFYYIPNTFIKTEKEDGKVKLHLPDDFKVTIKDKARNKEETFTVQEYIEETTGNNDYSMNEDRQMLYADKFTEVEKRLRENVPKELQARPNWCIVRTKTNEESGRLEKYIIDCHTGKFAESDNYKTWSTFDSACEYAHKNGGVALAYALDGIDRTCCIDLDHCVDDKGNATPLMTSVEQMTDGTYMEKSLSGKGYHFFGKTNGANVRTFSRDGDLEFYQKSHFIAMTGDAKSESELKEFDELPIMDLIRSKCDKRVEWKNTGKGIEGLSTMTDRDVVEKATTAKHGDVFKRLFDGEDVLNNHSNSDMSLMSRLAYWCNGDKEQMLRIFAASGLFRPNKTPDYYEGTAMKALTGNTGRVMSQQSVPLKPTGNTDGNNR